MKIRIRTKLAAALAVPLVGLVAVAGYEAVQASDAADDVREEAELATVAIGPSSLTTELQNERNYTALDLIGLAEAATLEVASVDEARERVDASIADLEVFLDGRGQLVADAFAPAFSALEDKLDSTRALWDEYEGDKDLANQPLADEVFEEFTTMTTAFFDATQTIAIEVDENSLRNGSEMVDQGNRRGELLASITRLIVLDTLTEGGEDGYRAEVAGLVERVAATDERISQLSVGPYAGVADETLGRPWDIETDEHFQTYLAGDPIDISALLTAVSAGGAEGIVSSGEMATDILASQAASLTDDADARRALFIAAAAAVVVLALLVSWLASRSITRPLRKLRSEAHDMASERLPDALGQILDTPLGEDVVIPELDPIEVKTRDEVREVVEVLNDVQNRTLTLAADQAVLRRNIADSFVNLGRRNQNLLDRQLEFITELEQSETEPEELESLFRLDHLATRMRRNAESLLVLAGVESPRQWSTPVSSEDVIRAALGEVEDYQRVTVRHLDDVMFAGQSASGISHVLAELIENALNFSPPDEPVELKGRLTNDGYLIAIADDGIGMSPEDIERANQRLSGEESYTVAPSRYLGHYVAGHLAGGLGIGLKLQDRPAGGVTATVTIPGALVVDAPVGDDEIALEAAASSWVDAHLEPESTGGATATEPGDPVSAHAGAPETLAEALGRPQIDSIDSVDDLTAAIDGIPGPAPANGSSLPKRVPGAQRPDLEPTIARRHEPAPAPAPAPEPATTTPETATSTDAFGFLAEYDAAFGPAKSATDHDIASEEDR